MYARAFVRFYSGVCSRSVSSRVDTLEARHFLVVIVCCCCRLTVTVSRLHIRVACGCSTLQGTTNGLALPWPDVVIYTNRKRGHASCRDMYSPS